MLASDLITIQMRHMLAKTYHLPCVYFSCIIALLSVGILKPKLIFSCNKSISLIVVMLLLFKSIFAEGTTEPRKKKGNFNPPLQESNTQSLAYGSDTLPLNHPDMDTWASEKTYIHIQTESVTRKLPKFMSWLEESFDWTSSWKIK